MSNKYVCTLKPIYVYVCEKVFFKKYIFKMFFRIIKTFFSKDTLIWSKTTVKAFIMLQKISISGKFCSFKLSIHQSILKKKVQSQFPQKYYFFQDL